MSYLLDNEERQILALLRQNSANTRQAVLSVLRSNNDNNRNDEMENNNPNDTDQDIQRAINDSIIDKIKHETKMQEQNDGVLAAQYQQQLDDEYQERNTMDVEQHYVQIAVEQYMDEHNNHNQQRLDRLIAMQLDEEVNGQQQRNQAIDAAIQPVVQNTDNNQNRRIPENNNQNHKCSICLEPLQNNQQKRYLPCTHGFHSDCIDPWLGTHRTCPVCRFDLDQNQ
eukprot:68545_1